MGLSLGVVAGIASAGLSIAGSYRTAEKEKKARQASMASQAQAADERRRQQVRTARIKRARIIAASQASGTSGSSSEAGALGALATNTASNIAFGRSQEGLANFQSSQLQKAANIGRNVGIAGSLFNVAGTAAGSIQKSNELSAIQTQQAQLDEINEYESLFD